MVCALYFGSFNPFHIGHAAIAAYILENCNVDSLRLVLTPVNPFKKNDLSLEDATVRLKHLEEAVERFNREHSEKAGEKAKKLEISTVEFDLPKPNYTYTTLQYLKEKEPETEFVIVMGGDNLAVIERWYKGSEILNEFKVMVYPRKGSDTKALCKKYGAIFLDAPLNDISSTMIREGIKEGKDMKRYIY